MHILTIHDHTSSTTSTFLINNLDEGAVRVFSACSKNFPNDPAWETGQGRDDTCAEILRTLKDSSSFFFSRSTGEPLITAILGDVEHSYRILTIIRPFAKHIVDNNTKAAEIIFDTLLPDGVLVGEIKERLDRTGHWHHEELIGAVITHAASFSEPLPENIAKLLQFGGKGDSTPSGK